jgi:hypothetical protein
MVLLSNLRIKSLAFCETFFQRLLLNCKGSPLAIDYITLKSSAPGNGGYPTSKTYKIAPKDQISHF